MNEQPKLWISGVHTDLALEEECRSMLDAGVKWFYKNPDMRPLFYGYFGMTGIIVPRNKVAEVVWAEAIGALGNMGRPNLATQQSVMSHVIAWQRRFYHHLMIDKMSRQASWDAAWADVNKEIQERQVRPYINGPGRYDPSIPGDGTEEGGTKRTGKEKTAFNKAARERKKRLEGME